MPMLSDMKACPSAVISTLPSILPKSGISRYFVPCDAPGRVRERIATNMIVMESIVIMGFEKRSIPFFTPPKLAKAVTIRKMTVYINGSQVELMKPLNVPE